MSETPFEIRVDFNFRRDTKKVDWPIVYRLFHRRCKALGVRIFETDAKVPIFVDVFKSITDNINANIPLTNEHIFIPWDYYSLARNQTYRFMVSFTRREGQEDTLEAEEKHHRSTGKRVYVRHLNAWPIK